VRTALTKIVAEELDVPMRHVMVIEGDTALTPDQGTTSGSFSIQNGGMQLRRDPARRRRWAPPWSGAPAMPHWALDRPGR